MDAIENGPKCDKTAAFRETNSGYLDKPLKFIYFFWAKLDYRCFTGIGEPSLTAKTISSAARSLRSGMAEILPDGLTPSAGYSRPARNR